LADWYLVSGIRLEEWKLALTLPEPEKMEAPSGIEPELPV
jgi:hypothetical protein